MYTICIAESDQLSIISLITKSILLPSKPKTSRVISKHRQKTFLIATASSIFILQCYRNVIYVAPLTLVLVLNMQHSSSKAHTLSGLSDPPAGLFAKHNKCVQC